MKLIRSIQLVVVELAGGAHPWLRFHIKSAPTSLMIGYRGLALDYEDTGNIEVDLIVRGPIIGLGFEI